MAASTTVLQAPAASWGGALHYSGAVYAISSSTGLVTVPSTAVSDLERAGFTVPMGPSGTVGVASPTWTSGNGAPSVAAPPGSIYSRLDGGTGATLYYRTVTPAWIAIA